MIATGSNKGSGKCIAGCPVRMRVITDNRIAWVACEVIVRSGG
jgi:hypothetical protein